MRGNRIASPCPTLYAAPRRSADRTMVTFPEHPPALGRAECDQRTGHGADEPGARRDGRRRIPSTNVAALERVASVVSGGMAAAYGLRRRDLTGVALAAAGVVLLHRGVTGRSFVFRALGVTTRGRRGLVQQRGGNAVVDAEKARRIEHVVTINADPEELYRYWRDFRNLPRVMRHLSSVTEQSATRSHWVAKALAGTTVEWDAEIISDNPGELISWKSVDKATVPNSGSVQFRPAPGERGTELRVVLEYEPPAGRLGALVARLFGDDPGVQVREDLRRFKQVIEAGEVATTDGQPSGRG
jgi:uncharacterized membrane protein